MCQATPFADAKQVNLQSHLISRHEVFLFRILMLPAGSCTDVAISLLDIKTSSSCKTLFTSFSEYLFANLRPEIKTMHSQQRIKTPFVLCSQGKHKYLSYLF